jgi:hypothetical protein
MKRKYYLLAGVDIALQFSFFLLRFSLIEIYDRSTLFAQVAKNKYIQHEPQDENNKIFVI